MGIRNRAVIVALVVWVLQIVTAAPAVEGLADARSRSVQLALTSTAWVVWAAGVLALLVPSTLALTAARTVAPLPLVAAVVGAIGGASAAATGVAVAGGVAAIGAVFNAELGRALLQGSAYGDEARFGLRPPVLLAATVVPAAWAAAVGAPLAAIALLAARAWIAGAVALLAAGALTPVALARLHRLSRRWLVFVPAGVVVHDAFAVAETAMFRRPDVLAISAAEVGTTALDLTAGAPGLVLEIRLLGHRPVTPLPRSGQPATPASTDAVLICPTQPGRVVAEFARRAAVRVG